MNDLRPTRFNEPVTVRRWWRMAVTFAAMGVVGTVVHYLVLVLLVSGFGYQPMIGAASGFVLGACVNYALNYRWTYSSKERHMRTLPRFMVVALVGLAVNVSVVGLLTSMWGLHYLLAQVLATIIVLGIGFLLNTCWTFRSAS